MPVSINTSSLALESSKVMAVMSLTFTLGLLCSDLVDVPFCCGTPCRLACCKQSQRSQFPISWRIVKKGVDKLVDVISHIWYYQTSITTLRAHYDSLQTRLSDTQRDVDSARSNGRDIKQQVEKWLQQTNAKVGDTDLFLESLSSASSPTCCWRFTCDCNCKRRYKAAIAAETLSGEIKTLLEECRFELGGVSFNPKPPPLAPTLAAGYVAVASREMLLERLKDLSTTLVIGVYGKKGAGKTMLVKRLAVAIESDGEFNGVVLTSAQRDATEIQQEIAERIGLSFTLRTRQERARWLHDRLVRIGKIVFIIDDVDTKIDLYEIGIPWPDNINGCRIVVVSSSSCVCKKMKTKMNLEVGPLSQQESLDLFDQLANGYSFASSNIQEARDHISAKQEWLPGEIEDIIGAIHNKPIHTTTTKSRSVAMVTSSRSRDESVMLAADALQIEHGDKPQY